MEGIVLVAHHRLLRCVLASFQGLFSQRGGHLFETSLARTFSTAMANKENKNEGAELGKEQEKIDNSPGKQNGSRLQRQQPQQRHHRDRRKVKRKADWRYSTES